MPASRDDQVLEAIAEALSASGRFDRVIDAPPWCESAGDRERAVAWVDLESFSTEGRSVDFADRVVRYRLWIQARAQEREGRQEARRRLVRLVEAAEGALNLRGLGLADAQPARSFVESGRHDLDLAGPSAAAELAGRVTLTRLGRADADAADRT
jgi:hypothetical protein